MAFIHISNFSVRINRHSDEFARMQSDRHVANSILCSMYEDDKLCDVSLYGVPPTGKEQSSLRPIRGYKNVLAHASKHLYELFTVDGYLDSHKAEYNLEIIDHETLRRIVDFIHTDSLMLNVQNAVEVVQKLLIGAKYLLMKDLAEGCENYLAEQVNSSNCLPLWYFARKYSCLKLMEATSTFIAAKHLKYLPKDDEFLRMPYADLAKLLMSEPIIVADGDLRFNAAIAWLEFSSNTDSRSKHAYDVMNMTPLSSGLLKNETILKANENEMLREHEPALLWEATLNAFKIQTKQVAVPDKRAVVAKTPEIAPRSSDCFGSPPFKVEVRFPDQSRGNLWVECTAFTTIGELKTRIKQLCGFRIAHLGRNPPCYKDFSFDSFALLWYGITSTTSAQCVYASR